MSSPNPTLSPDDDRVDNWSIVSRKRPGDRLRVWLYKDGELFWPDLITVIEADENDEWIKYLCATDAPTRVPRTARVKDGYDIVLDQ